MKIANELPKEWDMEPRGKPDEHGRFPCGCVRTRDFKGYGVTQLCDEHFYEARAK